MIYRALRWLIIAALTALLAYVAFRPEDAAAAMVIPGPIDAAYDQNEVIAAIPCAPWSHALGSAVGDKPPIP